MKNSIFTIVTGIFIITLGISSCKSRGSANSQPSNPMPVTYADNSKNSLDWAGTYTGIVPSASSSGIFTKITLKNDNTYSLQMEPIADKSDSMQTCEGSFQWNKAGSIISLTGIQDKSMSYAYLLGENKLIQLDTTGNVVTGDSASNYVLTKINENLVGKKWKLLRLKGVILSSDTSGMETNAFIIFQIKGNRVNGNSGCNDFAGTYTIKSNNQLYFSGVASTRKMCIDMTVEDQMNNLFKNVDNYTLQNDTLCLNQGETVLAQFVVAEP